MSDAVIVGLMSATGSIIVQLIISWSKGRETNATMAVHEQKQQDSLDEVKKEMVEIKKRLDQHNGYAEKFANASKDIAIIQKDIEYLKKGVK